MEMYLHDSHAMLRFVLSGELGGGSVRELEYAWHTAKSILRERPFVIDVAGLRGADGTGLDLLVRMRHSGAQVVPALPRSDGQPNWEPVARRRWSWRWPFRNAVRGTKVRHLTGNRRPGPRVGQIESTSSVGQ